MRLSELLKIALLTSGRADLNPGYVSLKPVLYLAVLLPNFIRLLIF